MEVGGQNIVRRRTIGSPMEYDALRCSKMSHRSPSYSTVGSVGPWLNTLIDYANDVSDAINAADATDVVKY